MDGKTKEALKQLHAEIRQLQTIVTGSAPLGSAYEVDDDITGKKAKAEAIVQLSVTSPFSAHNGGKPNISSFTELQLSRVTDESAASVGYALASPQKVGLLRALLGKESDTASALGEATGLSTGSLYHHLRELMRADLIIQSGRNRYVLSERGVRVLFTVLALAMEVR